LLPPLARDQSRRPQPVVARAEPAPPAPSIKPPAPKTATVQREKPPPAPKPQPAAATQIAENTSGLRDFIWPVSGQVLKDYGVGADGLRNDGVNIGVPKGTQVKASADGEVVYAGSELVGFGNLILIRHEGGWVSAYAHSESLLVKEGEMVRQGQPIASAGATGNASAPQVHFELRKGREPVDPADYLPALRG
jgi:murein DD-endopeptidase MepM/ murein hydrolase activator NlpD